MSGSSASVCSQRASLLSAMAEDCDAREIAPLPPRGPFACLKRTLGLPMIWFGNKIKPITGPFCERIQEPFWKIVLFVVNWNAGAVVIGVFVLLRIVVLVLWEGFLLAHFPSVEADDLWFRDLSSGVYPAIGASIISYGFLLWLCCNPVPLSRCLGLDLLAAEEVGGDEDESKGAARGSGESKKEEGGARASAISEQARGDRVDETTEKSRGGSLGPTSGIDIAPRPMVNEKFSVVSAPGELELVDFSLLRRREADHSCSTGIFTRTASAPAGVVLDLDRGIPSDSSVDRGMCPYPDSGAASICADAPPTIYGDVGRGSDVLYASLLGDKPDDDELASGAPEESPVLDDHAGPCSTSKEELYDESDPPSKSISQTAEPRERNSSPAVAPQAPSSSPDHEPHRGASSFAPREKLAMTSNRGSTFEQFRQRRISRWYMSQRLVIRLRKRWILLALLPVFLFWGVQNNQNILLREFRSLLDSLRGNHMVYFAKEDVDAGRVPGLFPASSVQNQKHQTVVDDGCPYEERRSPGGEKVSTTWSISPFSKTSEEPQQARSPRSNDVVVPSGRTKSSSPEQVAWTPGEDMIPTLSTGALHAPQQRTMADAIATVTGTFNNAVSTQEVEKTEGDGPPDVEKSCAVPKKPKRRSSSKSKSHKIKAPFKESSVPESSRHMFLVLYEAFAFRQERWDNDCS